MIRNRNGRVHGLELGASYYFASRVQATLPNTDGFTLPRQQMLGVSLPYSFNDKTKLEINASNLTNSANWTSNGAMFYGEPRTISASLSYKY
jgi:iron complex outermembrane recepter protein